jgi:hypothetical protein
MVGRKLRWTFALPLLAAIPLHAYSQSTTTVSGVVRDGITRELLARVRVECGGVHAETDAQGRFSLTCAEGPLVVATVGYRAVRMDPLPVGDVEIALFPATLRGTTESVTVEAGAFGREAPLAVSLEGVELKNLASVLADDPLRATHTLPGAASNDDFTSQFSVRGAGFDRVGLYYDGVLMHQPFHSVQGEASSGSLAIFNGDLLEGMDLYASAMPARYGDRTAGVLEMRPRDGDRKRVTGRVTASASNAAGLVEGPLGSSGRGSWILAVRRSYLQYLVERISDDPSLAFGFTDGQARLRYDLTAKHSATLAVLVGDSGLDRRRRAATAGANTLITADYRFSLATAALRSTLGRSVQVTNRIAWLRERSGNRNREESPLFGSAYQEWAGMSDASMGVRGSGLLEVGASFRRVRDDGFVYRYTFVPASVRPLERFRGSGWRSGGYVQGSRSWLDGRLTLTAGGRVDGHSVATPVAASPYASAAWQVASQTRVTAAWSHAVQYPEINALFSLFGSKRLLPQRSQHLLLSVDQRLSERTRVRVEGWRRLDRDLLWRPLSEVRIEGGRIVAPLPDAPYANTARARSEGVQVMLQRRSANVFSGWVAYAWSRSEVTDGVLRRSFYSDFDQRHQVQVFGNWRLRPTVNLSGRFVYGSGMPLPGFYSGSSREVFVAAQRNQVRLPVYARGDVRVNKSWQQGRLRWTLFGEVINVWNRDNVRFDSNNGYDARTGRARLSFITMIPILPSAGVLLEF